MSQPIISVEGLGKRYYLAHEKGQDTLRDTLTQGARGLWQRLNQSGKVEKKGEEFWALRDVSFQVNQGDVIGIIGRNGAGKSTLLKILSRITEPTTGHVAIRGRVASLLEVGTGFHPELSGRENIFLNGAILGMSRAEITRKFDEIVTFAEVERFLDTQVKHYSTGMYVRLAFAVAAHLEPEILIVDEVLAVGDAQFQKKCLGKMRDVTGQGRTVIFVSHNEMAVGALCNRALLMDQGKLLMTGTVSDVYQCYRRFAGEAAANIRVKTPWLEWSGLTNQAELQSLQCSDDITCRLRFQTGNRALEGVEFDCALVNEQGLMITHARSKFLGLNYNFQGNQTVHAAFTFRQPHLAPGVYTLTIYVRTEDRVLLWLEGVAACRVIALSRDFPDGTLLDSVRSVIIPLFNLDVS